ncbi:class F sortase [Asanoa sp. NPDC050611]|uniref:class F sortase n=1 Tax=Asanoa sp. NPDC050611 TaxID=3157098 RepID=UPI0033C3D637
MVLWPEASTERAGGRRGRKPWRAAGAVLVAVTALAGVGLLGASIQRTPEPPQPVAAAAGDFDPATAAASPSGPAASPSRPAAGATATTPSPTTPAPLNRSDPVTISIKRIGVEAKIMNLVLRKDGTLAVPPLNKAQLAGWYSLGPSPGEIGNAVIVGHVTTATDRAVFFALGNLRPKDTITVSRKDGTTASFAVDGVKSYPKTKFPTALVYGPNEKAGLRLVTCGGEFDSKARNYQDNVIVFATAA